MAKIRKEKLFTHCQRPRCKEPIPEDKRSDAKYCSDKCKNSEEKKRFRTKSPDYVKRQRRLVCEIRHKHTYGHTDFVDNPMGNPNDRFRVARSQGYRSGLEVAVARQLEALGIPFEYEKVKIPYKVDETRTYKPDYVLPNGIVVETKGRFVLEDRKKHLLIKSQHPHLDIRFVFTNSKTKIRKGSPTSYADWCSKNGFTFSDKLIPKEWLNE